MPVPSFTPDSIVQKDHGYEVDVPMQLIPEIVLELVKHLVGVYQVVRIHKL
jgi:hypothetical protein